LAKAVRWLGRSGAEARWRTIEATSPGPWKEIAACMLLANRSGAASRDDLEAFLRLVDGIAASVGAECVWPDEREEAGRAEELDRLCADLDVQIGLTILKGEQGQIAGTRLRGVAEAAGFRLNAAGHFEYTQEDTGTVLYSLQSLRGEPFTVESLRAAAVAGVVILLDVPRVAEPVKAFDQMRLLAKRLAQTLEATLVDDNRRPIDDAALAEIRAQVHATAAALREAHIEPGGQRTLRLFG
jgi:FtsZ-interacting cell division protein ZipA